MYSVLQENEKNLGLTDWTNPDICELFETQVAQNLDAIAVVYKGKSIDYRTLNANSNKLARFLIQNGIGKEKVAAVYGQRSIEFLISVIATFKSGGAYLPINPSFPDNRILQMLEQSQTHLILVTQEFFANAQHLVSQMSPRQRPMVAIIENIIKMDFSVQNPNIESAPEDLAYVIFTSGSTGKPKGAMVERRGMINHLLGKISDMNITENDRVAQTASQCFDISVWQFLAALIVGGEVHIIEDDIVKDPESLLKRVDQENISIMQVVPSALRTIVHYIEDQKLLPGHLESLRWLALVGEALPPILCRKWFYFYPNIPLLNSYGPTECADGVTHYLIYQAPDDSVINMPIGQKLPNLTIHVLEPGSFKEMVDGEIGELCVSGVGVGRGYIHDEARTKLAFFKNPFSEDPAYRRLYRTGDLVKYLPDGNLEYLGRIDRQIKIRGFRIELAEIESYMGKYDGVKACAVVTQNRQLKQEKIVARECLVNEKHSDEIKYLVAYIVSERGVKDYELKSYLKQHLPDYMVPEIMVKIPQLPLNVNGKLDVKALPEPEFIRPDLDKPYVAPRNELEKVVARIYQEILNIDGIGVDDQFLELGGDSLLAMKTLNRLQEITKVKLSFEVMFTSSIAEIANLIASEQKKEVPGLQLEIPEVMAEGYPLTLEQQRLWFLWKLEPKNSFYTLQGNVSIKGIVDIDRLKQAWLHVVKSHDGLRARFIENDGKPYQQFLEIEDIDFPIYNLVGIDKIKQDEFIKEVAAQEINNPFSLDKDLLFRLKGFQLSGNECAVLFTTHEIVMDAWSLSIIMRQLKKFYSDLHKGNCNPSNQEPHYNLRHYVYWENLNIRPDSLALQEEYWKNNLSGKLPVFDIPTDVRREGNPTYKGGSEGFLLDFDVSKKLKEISRSRNATLFMTLLTAFDILLYNYTGQEDIIIGSPHVNRNILGTEELVGFFLNMLPLRIKSSNSKTFIELLDNVKKTVVNGFSNSNYPFLWMVGFADTIRDGSTSPIFQVMFNMYSERPENNYKATADEADVIDTSFREMESGFTKYELTLYAQEHGEQIYLQFSYFADLYQKTFIQRMLKNFEVLLRSITENPERKISVFEFLTSEEKKMLVSTLNQTNRSYDYYLSIPRLFENQVAKTPEKVAYIFKNETITYRDLNVRVNQLTRYLKKIGLKQGMNIAICIERSFEMIIGMMAIMKLEATYVPLDPDYPLSRLEAIIEDTGVEYLITQSSMDRFNSFSGKKVLVNQEKELIQKEDGGNLGYEFPNDHVMNIIYTSSSTGRPKGVVISSKAVLNRLNWMWEEYPFQPDDVAIFHKSYSLVAATWECFGALLKGIPTLILTKMDVLDPAILWKKLTKHHVSYFLATPALIHGILEQGELHPGMWNSLRLATTSAEPIPVSMVTKWYRIFPNVPLLNLYGATECSSNAAVYNTQNIDNRFQRVPVGKPLSNTNIYIMNEHNQLVPYGVVGEMCVSGDCLALGYLNLDELNREKFIENPFAVDSQTILFKTGDLARYRVDGNIDLVGRKDNQVKIRGFRIELGDIELALLRHESIPKCAVKLFANEDGGKRLVAYIEAEKTILINKIRSFLLQYLPDYMIPSDYVFMDKIPLTQTGKVDRKVLEEPEDLQLELDSDFVAPQTRVEQFLVEAWSELLRRQRVGTHDNFFDLGGHSLLATQLISKIYNQFKVEIPVRKIFEFPTVFGLAKEIGSAVHNMPQSKQSVRVRKNKEIKPVEGIVPITVGQGWYLNLWDERIQPDRYNISRMFEVDDNFDSDKLQKALTYLWRMHDSLRARFTRHEGKWEQIISNPDQSAPCYLEYNLENVSVDEEERFIDQYAEQLQGSINISQGPLIVVAYLNFGKGRPGRLMVIVHHLVIDGNSMATLVNDLQIAYKQLIEGNPVNLQEKSITIKEWAELLHEYVASDKHQKDIGYWLAIPWQDIPDLPIDYPRGRDQNFVDSVDNVTMALTDEETKILTRQIPLKLNTEVINVLLWALTKVISKWTASKLVHLTMVSNGHDMIPDHKYLDLTRTLGWMAIGRCLVLEYMELNDFSDEISAICEQISKIPCNGYGYHLSADLNDDEAVAKKLQKIRSDGVVFNYKGSINQKNDEINVFKLVKMSCGLDSHPKNQSFCTLTINGSVIDDCFTMVWQYSNISTKRESIERLAGEFMNILQGIVAKLDS
jgi:surfactin family lipopeptide synthetase A